MTYEQYIEWQKFAASRIAEELERFSMLEGNNADVFFNHVAVDAPAFEVDSLLRQPDWEYVIIGSIEDKGDPSPPAISPLTRYLAAYVPRETGRILNDDVFVTHTSVVEIPFGILLKKLITYQVTTVSGIDRNMQNFNRALYRGGLKLNLLFYEQKPDGTEVPIRSFSLNAFRSPVQTMIQPPQEDKTYKLKIASVEKL